MQTLNPSQKKAVQAIKGRILVLAGAGSGKTKVLTNRIAHLINDHKVDPLSILALTFTNKAAMEMKNRLKKLIGDKKAKNVLLTTFHSFCVKLLRMEADKIGYGKNFSIYDDKDVKRLTSNMLKEENIDISASSLLESISAIKNKDLSFEEISDQKDKENIRLYSKIDSFLKAYNAIDFDSLLTLSVKLLSENKEILEKYSDRFKYILIDEYQDTNPIQYKLAELLAQKHSNIFVVGDDDQSIYGFRGSCIDHILNFKSDTVIKLEQNYRSTKMILHAANAVIKNNKTRHDKTLFSNIDGDEKVNLFHAQTEVEEAEAVVKKIMKLKKDKNLKWSDIAILYRSNALSRNFETHLINASYQQDGTWYRGIPYQIYGGLEFADRSETRDLISYLKVISNEKDEEALMRVINIPRRGISDKTIETIKTYAKENNISFFQTLKLLKDKKIDLNLQKKANVGIDSFVDIIEKAKIRFQQKPLHKAFEYLIEIMNYKKAIEEDVKSEKARIFKWENALECINALAEYEEEEQEANLEDFISTTMLSKDNTHKKQQTYKDKLQLMTIHSSKGLEFEACFIVGLEDHILPHEKSTMETSIEEERRLFYVAITRAKKYLTLSMARARKNRGSPKKTNPSRFLFEIPKDLLNLISSKTFD